jgi:hypothetical protein
MGWCISTYVKSFCPILMKGDRLSALLIVYREKVVDGDLKYTVCLPACLGRYISYTYVIYYR